MATTLSPTINRIVDMFYWEPVGALISTVLSQMILGTRVYAVSFTVIYLGHNVYLTHLASDIFTK